MLKLGIVPALLADDVVPEIIQPRAAIFVDHTPKTPKKRSNEINVSVWIDGAELKYTFTTNITGTILGSQQNEDGIKRLILESLQTRFGNVRDA